MSEIPEVLDQDHRRLVYLSNKIEPTTQDVQEAKEIVCKTQKYVSKKTNQTKNDYDAMYTRYDWTTDESSRRIEDWQKRANDLDWDVLYTLINAQTIAMGCAHLAEKAKVHAAEVNAMYAEDKVEEANAKADTESASPQSDSAQAKAREEPKDRVSGWEFLLQW